LGLSKLAEVHAEIQGNLCAVGRDQGPHLEPAAEHGRFESRLHDDFACRLSDVDTRQVRKLLGDADLGSLAVERRHLGGLHDAHLSIPLSGAKELE
jgi:hypothetical protein